MNEESIARDLRFRYVVYRLFYIRDGLQHPLYRIKESLRFSTAEQKKETLGYEPPEWSAGGRVRVWGFYDLDERFQEFRMRHLEDVLVEVGMARVIFNEELGLTSVASSKDRWVEASHWKSIISLSSSANFVCEREGIRMSNSTWAADRFTSSKGRILRSGLSPSAIMMSVGWGDRIIQ